MVVRRCTQRKFLLKPTKKNNQAFRFCAAVAAKTAKVQLLWIKVMSNHHHTGVHDPHGNIAIFIRELHRLVAKHHNASYGRFENFWASTQTSLIRLEDPDAVMDKLIYSLANAVQADLVDRAAQWPGVVTLPDDLCSTTTVERPKLYFRDEGGFAETVELRFHKPPGFEDLTDEAFRYEVRRRLRQAEHVARERRVRKRRKVVGRRTVRGQHHEDTPTTWAKRFRLKPRVATKDKWRRIEALARLEGFIESYRDALQEWRAGNRRAVFPYGTTLMRVVHGVCCAPAPS